MKQTDEKKTQLVKLHGYDVSYVVMCWVVLPVLAGVRMIPAISNRFQR